MLGFKVVHKGVDQLSSASISAYGSLTYTPHIWTHPRLGCGPLCILSDIRKALNWVYNWPRHFVYPCEYVPSDEQSIYLYGTHKVDLCDLRKVLRSTELAKAVKLISSTPIKTGWKITFQDRSFNRAVESKAWVKYEKGSWTIPNKDCGPLTCFDTKENAEDFLNKYAVIPDPDGYEVRLSECIYCEPSQYKVKRLGWNKVFDGPGKMGKDMVANGPKGTVLAERIMLI